MMHWGPLWMDQLGTSLWMDQPDTPLRWTSQVPPSGWTSQVPPLWMDQPGTPLPLDGLARYPLPLDGPCDLHFFRNIAASRVGAPYEVGAPYGNPGSATAGRQYKTMYIDVPYCNKNNPNMIMCKGCILQCLWTAQRQYLECVLECAMSHRCKYLVIGQIELNIYCLKFHSNLDYQQFKMLLTRLDVFCCNSLTCNIETRGVIIPGKWAFVSDRISCEEEVLSTIFNMSIKHTVRLHCKPLGTAV